MKGQILSVDLMFAVLIILIIISTLTLVLTQYAIFEGQQSRITDASIKAQAAADALLLTPGVPSDWETRAGT